MHDDNKLIIKVEANFNSNLLVDNINFLALHPMSYSCYLSITAMKCELNLGCDFIPFG